MKETAQSKPHSDISSSAPVSNYSNEQEASPSSTSAAELDYYCWRSFVLNNCSHLFGDTATGLSKEKKSSLFVPPVRLK